MSAPISGAVASARAEPGRAERVVVAMSGGVDSSLAAALVVAQGCEAIGITMHLAGGGSRCCSLADADDARAVADRLGIRFFVANYAERFRAEVIEAFADDYLAGRTPIPCVACNTRFKFAYLLERARLLGAQRVATGHYARVDRDPRTGLWRLRRAADRAKDQSYFLFQLDQAQLAAIEFPLGALTKSAVRERARRLGLATAEKPESQEICFVPQGGYAEVVEALRPDALPGEGDIVDAAGRVLGRHGGIHRFTVGQPRRGGRGRRAARDDGAGGRRIVGGGRSSDCRRARCGAGAASTRRRARRTGAAARRRRPRPLRGAGARRLPRPGRGLLRR
jgi:tRNA-specific 2-thiouridylase